MDQQNLPTRHDREDLLLLAAERLGQASAAEVPGRELEWADNMRNALRTLERHLRQQIAVVQAPNGPLAEVDRTRPTLARQAGGLCRDYRELLAQCLTLQGEVERAAAAFAPAAVAAGNASIFPEQASGGSVPIFGAIRKQAEELIAGVKQDRDTEAALLLESVNTDLGAGD